MEVRYSAGAIWFAGALCASMGACTTNRGSMLNMLNPADGRVVKQFPYEVSAHLTLDGVPTDIDRSGTCGFHTGIPIGVPPNITTFDRWEDDTPDAIALVQPDDSAVIVVLPELCNGLAGKPLGESDVPLIVLSKGAVQVIWIPDLKKLDTFEEYHPALTDVHFPHADLTEIMLKPLPDGTQLPEPLPLEVTLARRFQPFLLPQGIAGYFEARGAYVMPESFWSKDPYLVKLFEDQKQPVVFDRTCTWPKDPDQKLLQQHLIALGHPVLYEVPMVKAGDLWVLDEAHRGTLTYVDANQHPDARTSVPLSYKGLSVQCGVIYDPAEKVLIMRGYFATIN